MYVWFRKYGNIKNSRHWFEFPSHLAAKFSKRLYHIQNHPPKNTYRNKCIWRYREKPRYNTYQIWNSSRFPITFNNPVDLFSKKKNMSYKLKVWIFRKEESSFLKVIKSHAIISYDLFYAWSVFMMWTSILQLGNKRIEQNAILEVKLP